MGARIPVAAVPLPKTARMVDTAGRRRATSASGAPMRWHSWYYLWTTGNFTASTTISLDVARRYLVTGGLTLRNGDDDAHVYISTVCTGSGPILCGVRDTSGHVDLGLNEPLPVGARSVTIKLRTTGGRHRAEGFVYEV